MFAPHSLTGAGVFQQVMLKGLLFSEMEQLIERIGEKQGRAAVLAGWLYHER